MNTVEACNILGVSQGASKEEINKAFRQKAKELHPDKNKSENAEAEFKKANEAYQFLSNPQPVFNSFKYNNYSQQINFNDFFGFRQNSKPSQSHVIYPVTISFEESILGCVKEVQRDQKIVCSKCNGDSKMGKICDGCRGTGHVIVNNTGNIIFSVPCGHCKGSGRKTVENVSCDHCKNLGVEEKKFKASVKIPAGTFNNQRVCLYRCGDFDTLTGDLGDLIVNVFVTEDNSFKRNGLNVSSVLNLTLLEALKGCVKTVRTVKGEKKLNIKPGIKNNDIINVKGYGVPPAGVHQIEISVSYPENKEKLIEFLEKENNV